MKKHDAFPSPFVSKEDVATPLRLTIASVAMEELTNGDEKETKPVMSFRENGSKKMVLNNTNWILLEESFGDESDNWIGQKIELYLDPSIMFGGKRVGGVRVRAAVPVTEASFSDAPPAAEVLSFDAAIALCSEVGITKDQLVAKLKELGLSAYNPARDTATVRQIVLAEKSQIPF